MMLLITKEPIAEKPFHDEIKKITFKTTDEWWTRTSSEDGIMYATSKGWVKAAGDQVVRDKGVRPAIWISLE